MKKGKTKNKFKRIAFIKIYAIFICLPFSIAIVRGILLSIGCPLWLRILSFIILFLLYDLWFKKLFCRIIVEKDMLIYKSGGFVWRWIDPVREYPWKSFNYKTIWFSYKNKIEHGSLVITNKEGKKCLKLSHHIAKLEELIELVKEYNPDIKLASLEDKVRDKLGF